VQARVGSIPTSGTRNFLKMLAHYGRHFFLWTKSVGSVYIDGHMMKEEQ
jgi:hypothetical protein